MNISNKSHSFLFLAQELRMMIKTHQVAENVTEAFTNKDLV